jgi:acyl dehydratase
MMEVGQTFSRPYVFTREGIKRFAEEAGDENPLHRDEAEAAASRFGGIIASGAHMSGVLMSLAASQLAGMRESVGQKETCDSVSLWLIFTAEARRKCTGSPSADRGNHSRENENC